MKVYQGERRNGSCRISVIEPGYRRHRLRRRADLWNHSPTGFNWGYGGSGPAQTAIALLADVLDAKSKHSETGSLAIDLHQEFKREVVSGLPDLDWRLTEHQIKDWVAHALKKAQEVLA